MTVPRAEPTGGRVEDRLGVATMPLAGGLALVTCEHRTLQHDVARRLAPGHPALLTVAVSTQDGGFVIGQFEDRHRTSVIETVNGGIELAAALSSLPLYGRDLRLWLGWPQAPAERRALAGQLAALAGASGATVWTPATGATAVLLDGCQDLAAIAPGGRPARWQDHRPEGATGVRFHSDVDGRLVPAGGPVVRRVGGVAVIGVPADRDGGTIERYRTVWSQPGLCCLELTVLDDGRLALPYADGSLLAVGPRELRRLLCAEGWTDEDLCLLAPLTLAQAAGIEDHLHALAGELAVDIFFRTPDAHLSIQDGHPRVLWPDQRPGEWHRVTPPGAGPRPARWRSDDGWLEPVAELDSSAPAPIAFEASPAPEAPPTPTPATLPGAPTAVHAQAPPAMEAPPALVEAAPGRPSGLAWLPVRPPVNATPLRLAVRSSCPPASAGSEGVPSDELFLLGILEAASPAGPAGSHLLRLHVEPGAAVAAALVSHAAPTRLRARLRVPQAYLVPAGWLDRVCLLPDEPAEGRPARPVVLRCTGAAHGIDGLPNDVVSWPRSRPGRAFALYPLNGADASAPLPEMGGLVRLYHRRPPAATGRLLLQLRLGRAAAIDVAASAAGLAGLPLVRSRLGELEAAGVELLLPRASSGRAHVIRAFAADGGTWRAVPDLVGHTGADLFGVAGP